VALRRLHKSLHAAVAAKPATIAKATGCAASASRFGPPNSARAPEPTTIGALAAPALATSSLARAAMPAVAARDTRRNPFAIPLASPRPTRAIWNQWLRRRLLLLRRHLSGGSGHRVQPRDRLGPEWLEPPGRALCAGREALRHCTLLLALEEWSSWHHAAVDARAARDGPRRWRRLCGHIPRSSLRQVAFTAATATSAFASPTLTLAATSFAFAAPSVYSRPP